MHPTEQLAQQSDPDRQKKIIVALFLILGKALKKLKYNERDITVTESEIKQAWFQQKSPVRIVSHVEPSLTNWGEERIFKTVLEELDLNKVGFTKPGEAYPQEKIDLIADDQKPKRAFQLE